MSGSTSGDGSRSFVLPDLRAAVDQLLTQVPRGCVTTYGNLARALGDVRAARWIGEYLLNHQHSETCPCHRVIRQTGEVGLYATGDPHEKQQRLQAEGVVVERGRVVEAHVMAAAEFRGPSPLRDLQVLQEQVARRVCQIGPEETPRMLCGLDVAYCSDGTAVGAAVLLDAGTLTTVTEITCSVPAAFPYIPGYLTFRELPVLTELWETVRPQADVSTVCFVDGNGRLHLRRAGIASAFGVLADVPTIGVAKSLLCGRVEPTRAFQSGAIPIVDGDDWIGAAIQTAGSRRAVYVSVGHRITLAAAVELVLGATTSHRLPEPIRRADRLSKRAKPK